MALPDPTQQDAPAPAFTWGAGGARMTPEDIAARRKVADALALQGSDSSAFPVGTRGAGLWTQGLARVAKGLEAGLLNRRADEAAQQNADDNKAMLERMWGGAAAPTTATTTATPTVAATDVGDGEAQQAFRTLGATPGEMKLVQIESGFKPGQVTGSNQGYGQFSPDLQAKYGIKNPDDPEQVLQGIRAERADFEKQAGRPLSDADFYLMHQQGQAGGPALMNADPNTPAWKAVRPFYPSDAVAQQAIWGNVPDTQKGQFGGVNNVSAGQFRSLWGSRFGDGGAPAPVQVASNGPLPVAGAPAAATIAPTKPVVASDDDEEDTPAATPAPAVAKVTAAMPAGAPVAAAPVAPAAPSPAVARVTAAMPPPVAPIAPSPAVAKVSGALSGVNPGVLQALTSPYADPATKQIAGVMLQSQLAKANKDHFSQYTDKDGNIWKVNDATNDRSVVLKADSDPTSVKEWNFYKSQLPPGQTPIPYDVWSTAKARAAATNVTTNVGGEDTGLKEAQRLDAETVRKGQNEQVPALDDADRNFQIMQDAIDRNGGKLPTGGVLAKMGLDARRTSDYIRNNWGIDLGDDPATAANLETFNKGGIKASGDMAKAIGGSRVLKVEFDMAQRANPGLETTDGGNKYLIDLNRSTIAIKKDYLQAQEDYWRAHNHSLDGFQKSWNDQIKANPRPISGFSVVPPIDLGDGTSVVKLPSTAQGGYSWYRKGPDGNTILTDKDVIAKAEDMTKPQAKAAVKPAGAVEKTIGNKNYWKDGSGNWHEDGVN